MTIKSRWTEKIEKIVGSFLYETSVWTAHTHLPIKNKNSNVYYHLKRIFNSDKKIQTIWIRRGAHNRSDHSAHSVLIFDITGIVDFDYSSRGRIINREEFNQF